MNLKADRITADQLTPSQRNVAERFVRNAIQEKFYDLEDRYAAGKLDYSVLTAEALNAQLEALDSGYHFKDIKLAAISHQSVLIVIRVGRKTSDDYAYSERFGMLTVGPRGGVAAYPRSRKGGVKGWKAYIYAWD